MENIDFYQNPLVKKNCQNLKGRFVLFQTIQENIKTKDGRNIITFNLFAP